MNRESGVNSRELKIKALETRNKVQEEKLIRSNNQSVKSVVKKELQKQQKNFQQLEEQIAKLNEKKQDLEAALADPATYSDKNRFLQTENDYKKNSEELIKLNFEYEKVFENILKLENQ